MPSSGIVAENARVSEAHAVDRDRRQIFRSESANLVAPTHLKSTSTHMYAGDACNSGPYYGYYRLADGKMSACASSSLIFSTNSKDSNNPLIIYAILCIHDVCRNPPL